MTTYYYHNLNPEIISVQIEIDKIIHQRMIQCIEGQIGIANYHGGYTFEILDPYHDFAVLYNKFFNIAMDIFAPLTLSAMQKHWCWANVYNYENFRTNMHDHSGTCTINSVFYLQMPKDCKENEGGIAFLLEDKEYYYIPDELELLIMPSWQKHSPLYHSSETNRIAINMELSAVEKSKDLYTLDKIFKKCQSQ